MESERGSGVQADFRGPKPIANNQETVVKAGFRI